MKNPKQILKLISLISDHSNIMSDWLLQNMVEVENLKRISKSMYGNAARYITIHHNNKPVAVMECLDDYSKTRKIMTKIYIPENLENLEALAKEISNVYSREIFPFAEYDDNAYNDYMCGYYPSIYY